MRTQPLRGRPHAPVSWWHPADHSARARYSDQDDHSGVRRAMRSPAAPGSPSAAPRLRRNPDHATFAECPLRCFAQHLIVSSVSAAPAGMPHPRRARQDFSRLSNMLVVRARRHERHVDHLHHVPVGPAAFRRRVPKPDPFSRPVENPDRMSGLRAADQHQQPGPLLDPCSPGRPGRPVGTHRSPRSSRCASSTASRLPGG
jgi:hypothetical protein